MHAPCISIPTAVRQLSCLYSGALSIEIIPFHVDWTFRHEFLFHFNSLKVKAPSQISFQNQRNS